MTLDHLRLVPPAVIARCGAIAALLGVGVALGWYLRWPLIIHGSTGLPAMKFNAALCFIFAGVSVALTPAAQQRTAALLAGITALVSGVTLCEYAADAGSSFDQFLVGDYLTPAMAFPGRMSPLSAACFFLIGIGLLFAQTRRRRLWRVVGVLACLAGITSVVALGGFLSGIEAAYGWGAYTRMAPHTAAGLLLLSLSLLAWAGEMSRREQFDLRRWLPLAGSVILMVVVAALAGISMHQLRASYSSRSEAYATLVTAQNLLGGLTDTMRGARSYALSGQAEALQFYEKGRQTIPPALTELAQETRGNPELESRVVPLTADFHAVIAYAGQLIESRHASGLQGAVDLEREGQGREVVSRVRADLQVFTDRVQGLLLARETAAERDFRSTVLLLVIGIFFASVLLLLAHLLASREMTRRQHMEASLYEASALNAAIIDSANFAIISTSVEGSVTTFNETAERWLGYAAADIIGKVTPALWHDPEEVVARATLLSKELGRVVSPGFEAFVAKARPGAGDEHEWTLIRKDGTRFPAWLSVSALTDTHGELSGYVGVIADITERKQHEADMRVSEDRFRRAFDDAPIGMALVSPEGQWLKVNHALTRMLGYSESELLATDFQTVTHPEDLEADLVLLQQVLAGRRSSYQMEKRYLHKQGKAIPVMLSVSLVRGRNLAPLYFVSQIEDISERTKVQRLQSEFVSTVSHELRTPLTSIRGALGLINGGVFGPLSDKIAAMVRIAHQNAERLVLIINDILDIEKIEAGKIQLRAVRVSVSDLLQQAVSMNQAYAEKFGVALVLEPVPGDIEVLADPDRLMQVLTNLLSNGAKFSTSGTSVSLRAAVAGTTVRFEVQDHGIGIPEDFRSRIFEKFAQAEATADRRFAGTGLGLAITKALVEQMRGSIGFDSRVGGGTTFYVELPRIGTAPQSTAAVKSDVDPDAAVGVAVVEAPKGAAAAPRLLHIEDDDDLSSVLQATLLGRAEIVVARSLEAARRLLREQTFSGVVLDPGLPDGDGLTLLDQIEGMGPHAPPTVILSVTEMAGDIRRRVAATLIKSRLLEADVADTILAVVKRPAA